MKTMFLEAGHGPAAPGNWGKFMIARYEPHELTEPTRYPGCEGRQGIVNQRGWAGDHFWVLDLVTGEGVRFHVGAVPEIDAHNALEEHPVWVCPLFEPMLVWLFKFVGGRPETWWDELPRTIDLPDAPFQLYGYRRSGTCALPAKAGDA
jgi:hypothetical protein